MISDADLQAILSSGGIPAARWLDQFEQYECRTSLEAWCCHALAPYGHSPAKHHRLLISYLERVANKEIPRLMVLMPPGSAKTTFVSKLFVSWLLQYQPGCQIIGASHTVPLALDISGGLTMSIQTIIKENQDILGYGLLNEAKERWYTTNGGCYLAAGVGVAIPGFRASGCAIIDDPIKSREDAESAGGRKTIWDWYNGSLERRLTPGCPIVLMHTRWRDDDLAGMLLAAEPERWTVLSLPAEAEVDDPLGRAPGEMLWGDDEYGYAADLKIVKRDLQNRGANREWTSQYQQRPVPEEGDYFKAEWLRYYENPPLASTMRIYGASDYAVTKEGGDYTVHGVIGLDPADNIYILDWWREQSATDEWVEAFCDLAQKWKPLMWAEERGQIISSVGPFLDRRLRERRIFPYRRQFTSSHDKQTRAQSIRGRMAMGKVYFPRREPWANDLVNELLRFDAGKNDDQVDVLSLVGRMLDVMVPGTAPKRELPIRGLQGMTMDEAWKELGKPQRERARL